MTSAQSGNKTTKCLLLAFAMSAAGIASAQESEKNSFTYLGINGGLSGGDAFDETQPTFGLQGFHLRPYNDRYSWGVSADFFRLTSDETVAMPGGDMTVESEINMYVVGLITGVFNESSAGYIGIEYVGLNSAKVTASGNCGGLPCSNFSSSISGGDGEAALSAGYFVSSQNSGLTGGIGGRYILTDPGIYSIYLSVGYRF